MNAALRRCVAGVVVCLLLLTCSKQAKADALSRDVTLVFVGVAAVAAAITVGIVYAVRHKPSLTGCTTHGPNGLALKNEGDGKTYALDGDLAKLTEGQRVRVRGKKKDAGATKQFAVIEVTKNYGACPAGASGL